MEEKEEKKLMEGKPCCGNCFFGIDPTDIESIKAGAVTCIRFPPTPMLVPRPQAVVSKDPTMQLGMNFYFPMLAKDKVCGEHPRFRELALKKISKSFPLRDHPEEKSL